MEVKIDYCVSGNANGPRLESPNEDIGKNLCKYLAFWKWRIVDAKQSC